MGQPVLTFRECFWHQWRWATSLLGIGWVGLTFALSALGIVSGWPDHLHLLLVGSLVGAPGCGLLEALAVWCNVVYVAADGLKSYDGFGRYHFAPWPTIEGVRRVNFLGARYLLVRSSVAPREVHVPLFLADLPGFRATVVDRAGPDNPLAEALLALPGRQRR